MSEVLIMEVFKNVIKQSKTKVGIFNVIAGIIVAANAHKWIAAERTQIIVTFAASIFAVVGSQMIQEVIVIEQRKKNQGIDEGSFLAEMEKKQNLDSYDKK